MQTITREAELTVAIQVVFENGTCQISTRLFIS
jgi:hypothetical protein